MNAVDKMLNTEHRYSYTSVCIPTHTLCTLVLSNILTIEAHGTPRWWVDGQLIG